MASFQRRLDPLRPHSSNTLRKLPELPLESTTFAHHYWTSIWDEEWTRILPSAPRDRSQWHKCLVRTCATFIEKPLEWSDTPPKGNGGLGLRWGDAGLF